MGRMNRGRLAARVDLGGRTRIGPHAAVVRGASAQIRARVPSPIQRGVGREWIRVLYVASHDADVVCRVAQAHLCILAQDCDSAEYVRLVEALAQEHSIPIIKVPDGKQLGEWVGLCKLDREGQPKKVVKCSCAVVKDYGESSEAKTFLQDYIAKQG